MKQIQLTTKTIIGIVMAVSIAVRILFALYQPHAPTSADSIGYYNLGMEMIKHPTPKTIISEFRTPLYPLFIASLGQLSGFNNVIEGYIFGPDFHYTGRVIMGMQQFLGIVGIFLLVSLLVYMKFSNLTIFALSLFTSLNIIIFFWERTILTEGLATTTLLLLLFFLARIMKSPKSINFLFLWICFGVNFLLRPALILLPIVTLPFIFLSLHKRVDKVKVIVTLIASILIPILYIAGNSVYHNYRGIQHVGDIDVFGRILEFNIPLDAGEKYTYFYEKVTEYKNNIGGFNAFAFIDYYDINMYTNTTRMNELQGFARTILLHNLPSYTTNAIATIPQIMVYVSPSVREILDAPTSPIQIYFSGLALLYGTLLPLSLLTIPLYPIAIYLFFQKKSVKRVLLAILGSVAVSYVVLTSFVVFTEDYGRLLSPMQPLFLVFIIGTIQELLQKNILFKNS